MLIRRRRDNQTKKDFLLLSLYSSGLNSYLQLIYLRIVTHFEGKFKAKILYVKLHFCKDSSVRRIKIFEYF